MVVSLTSSEIPKQDKGTRAYANNGNNEVKSLP